jgi:hypothetical protein
MLNSTLTIDDVLAANRYGQQLFLADMHQTPKNGARPFTFPEPPPGQPTLHMPARSEYRQLTLVQPRRDLLAGRRNGFLPPPAPVLAAYLFQSLREHARTHGWSERTRKKTRRGLEILLGLQDNPGEPIEASLVLQLNQLELPAQILIRFLSTVDMLHDDRTPAIHNWFATTIAELPEGIRGELEFWFNVMWHGHTSSPPRSRARHQNTIRNKLRRAMPVLRQFVADGHQSLREITRQDILAALPAEGLDRFTTGQGLRSIFKVLKAHKQLFTDPMLHLKLGSPQFRQPSTADLAVIRDALNSPDPTTAALTALLAFHAVRSGQLRAMQLIDVRDDRLHLGDRTIPLAQPVTVRLAAYLDYRNQRWPNTANPHLFIHYRTAIGLGPVGTRWLGLKLGTAAHDIRTDRILDEVRATGGDVRRICDLFGLSPSGAMRYVATLEHPDLAADDDRRGEDYRRRRR